MCSDKNFGTNVKWLVDKQVRNEGLALYLIQKNIQTTK